MSKAAREKVRPFPIVEAFGYAVDSDTAESRRAKETKACPFSKTPCEKFRQYGFGYCSVTYAAADDGGIRCTYAVCDHRLDGPPVNHAIADHFGDRAPEVRLVPEVSITDPKMSFDFAAITTSAGVITDVAVIETQSIDIRGGGVGPAWEAWMEGRQDRWREYFTKEARKKGRKDTVAYGVNMANIYKRLGLQVAVKGSYLKGIKVPLYVVMQHRPFEYLRRRIGFEQTEREWDLTFVTFEYTGARMQDGSLELNHRGTVRTTLTSYVDAMANSSSADREQFLKRIKRKAGLAD